ncbi:energy-coupling factor transporter transmembrane component T family protein [Halobacteriales archaeon Cl-PHB]
MLTYEPGDSLAHRLDARSKLVFQFGLALAAFAWLDARWIGFLLVLGLATLAMARLSPLRVLYAYRYVLVVLAVVPFVAGLTLGDPWFIPRRAIDSALGVARVVPVLLVSAAYTATTPVRETRAAIQRHVPGKPGQALGVGVGLVFRFYPLVLADVRSVREAIRARGGDARSYRDRGRRIAVRGLQRAVDRADRLSVALQARCFAWNPTLPTLSLTWVDYPVLLLGLGLAVTPLLV